MDHNDRVRLAEVTQMTLEQDRKILAWRLYDAKVKARSAREYQHYMRPYSSWGRGFQEALPVAPSFPRPTGARIEYDKMTEEELKTLAEVESAAEKQRKRTAAEYAQEEAGTLMENAQDELDRLAILVRTGYFLILLGAAALVAIWPLSWFSWLPMLLAILLAVGSLSGGITLVWKHWTNRRKQKRRTDRASRAYTKTTLNTDLYL